MTTTDKTLTNEQQYTHNTLQILKEVTSLDWAHKSSYHSPFYLHQTPIADRAYKFYWGTLGATFRLVEANGNDISNVSGLSGLTIESSWKAFKDDMIAKTARWHDQSVARQAAIKSLVDALGGVDKWEWDRYKLDGMISSEEIYSVSVDDKVSITRQGGKLILVDKGFDKHYEDVCSKAAQWDAHCKSLVEYPINKIDTMLETICPDEEKRKVIKAKIDLMQHFGYTDKNWLYKEILNGK